MDGIILCRQLKEDVRTSHIPVILLTAKDSLQDKEEGYEVGADSYLTKPFSASLLRSRINNLLESRKKLIAQFQTQSVPGNQADLKEKRIVIAEALSKLDNEFIEKITLLIEENLSSEKIDITYLSDKMYERFHPLPENESTDRIIDQRIYPESENAKCRTFIA